MHTVLLSDLPSPFLAFQSWLQSARRGCQLSPLYRQALDIIAEEVDKDLEGQSETGRCAHFTQLAEQVLDGIRHRASLAMNISGVRGIPAVMARRYSISIPRPPEARSQTTRQLGTQVPAPPHQHGARF